ncbi:Uncharacterised protein [Staphylococcus aureus]|nr:Uncharacterised protein [Staphylococcus aureus]
MSPDWKIPKITITIIGINLITKVTDCKIPPALEPRKLINTIDKAEAIAIGIKEPADKWNKLIN